MTATRTLVYLHGFRSSSQSVKAQLFMRAVEALPETARPLLHVPDLPFDPAAAVESVAAWIVRDAGGARSRTRVDADRQLARRLLRDASRRAFRRSRGGHQSDDTPMGRSAALRRHADESPQRRTVRGDRRAFRSVAIARACRASRGPDATSCWCARATRCSPGATPSSSTPAHGSLSSAAAITAGPISQARFRRYCGLRGAPAREACRALPSMSG